MIEVPIPEMPEGVSFLPQAPPIDETTFAAFYFDKTNLNLVRIADIVESDGERYEMFLRIIIEEEWIPLDEAGDLFDPARYGLTKMEMTFPEFLAGAPAP